MVERRVPSLTEDFIGLGFSERTPGGPDAFRGMCELMEGAFIPEGAEQPRAEAGAAEDDPIDGPVVTEAMLEYVCAMPWERMGEQDIEDLIHTMEAREVPEGLEERTREVMGQVLDELKKVRIQAGKMTRVNVRRGSKAMRERRKRKIEYKKHKAQIKLQRIKRSRKAGAKMAAAKTARKHASMGGALGKIARKLSSSLKKTVGRVKAATGGGGLVKHESDLAARLANLLAEGRGVAERSEAQRQRDDLVEGIGEVLLLIEWIVGDEETVGVLAEAYEELADAFCGGALTEAKVDEAAFIAQVAPLARAIGLCMAELRKNFGSPA